MTQKVKDCKELHNAFVPDNLIKSNDCDRLQK